MQANKLHRLTYALTAFIFGWLMSIPTPSLAISSSNFQVQEDFFGGGGSIDANSANYNAQDSLGASAAGDGAGTGYNSQSGATTTSDPNLSVSIDTSSVNLGSLSTSTAKTGTATFSITNYTAYGYIAQMIGGAPNNGIHTLTALASPTASTAGTEQFGMNLVANTSPATFGADPQQIPDNTFSFGAAASGYATANSFKYVAGNTIASAAKSSGKTTYTISYIENMAITTPPGSYSGTQTLVVVGTY